MYRLFYARETGRDVLYIVIEPSSYPEEVKTVGDVTSLYKEGRLVGINIHNLTKHLKIRANGLIVAPADELIDVVNNMLVNAGLEKLPYCRDSGYKVAKVTNLEEHPLNEKLSIVTLSLGNETLATVTRYALSIGDYVVIAKDGCIKFDGTVFSKRVERNIPIDCELCSEADLHLGEEFKSALHPEGYEEGMDFFLRG